MINQFQHIVPERPLPITDDIDVICINRRTDTTWAVEEIIAGNNILIHDFYSTGLNILLELKKYLETKYTNKNFLEQRNFRNAFHALSQKIFIEIKNNTLLVRKSPEIGWLKILYPDVSDFVLTFTDVQGLNSSWQWYQKGIFIPLIGRKIHPYYKTYFPTRFEHLELFENWIHKYNGLKKNAFDIGIGSGILSYKLLKTGFEKVYGTDININALIGITNEITKNISTKLDLCYGDLFAEYDFKSELIIFNPPWLPASSNASGLDNAMYYEKELFPRFFDQANNHLSENGKIVILFSNLAQVTGSCITNPIEEEIKLNNRFKLNLFETKNVQQASTKTHRNQSYRTKELVELWVLEK